MLWVCLAHKLFCLNILIYWSSGLETLFSGVMGIWLDTEVTLIHEPSLIISTGVKSYSQSTLRSVQTYSNYLVKCSHFASFTR